MTRSRREFLKLGTVGTMLGCTPFLLHATNIDPFPAAVHAKRFLKACAAGDLETVQQYLQKEQNLLSAKDKGGRSGFALALLAGHHPIAELLKQSGYQTDLHEAVLDLDWKRFETLIGEETATTVQRINADHAVGGSVMWAAAAGGAGSDIWRVYGKCGDPNWRAPRSTRTSALQKALRFPDLATAEMTAASLLSNYADATLAPDGDSPPLHIAAERGSYALVEMLVRLGADLNRKDQKGKLPVQLAEQSGHWEVWKLLQNHEQIPRTCRTSHAAYNADGQVYSCPDLTDKPLFRQSKLVGLSHGNLEMVQKTVEADPAMAHSVATTGEKAVEAAAHMGRQPIVEYLLQHGAPYSLPTAVMLNDFTTVKRLLDEDPKRIEERGAHDFALLWYPVIAGGNLEMTQLLLDRGSKVEQQHFLGTTALHWACMRGPLELVELLVENGADLNRVGRKFKAVGESPLQMTKDEKITDFLRSRGAKS